MDLTVIVTVYNIAEYLPRFFDAMAKQTYKDYVLLVIDDGSEDDSLEVCRRYAEQDSRIALVPSKHLGIAGIKNFAMEHIHTEFTAYVDGDDYVEPDYLKHLMDAQKKYDADLTISRVQYLLENGAVEGEFRERGEMLITKEAFSEQLPMLLDDRRLNYVYGKVYRSALLKDIRVDADVRQGMDTMINFMYLERASSIVLIDDLDYHYIRYTSRSITSYSGEDAYLRILRINRFIYDKTSAYGFLTDEMQMIIDKRILLSAQWVIDKIMSSAQSEQNKAEQITGILSNADYIASYQRQKGKDEAFGFEIIKPQDGSLYIRKTERRKSRLQTKARILALCPKPLVRVYHKLKGIDNEE